MFATFINVAIPKDIQTCVSEFGKAVTKARTTVTVLSSILHPNPECRFRNELIGKVKKMQNEIDEHNEKIDNIRKSHDERKTRRLASIRYKAHESRTITLGICICLLILIIAGAFADWKLRKQHQEPDNTYSQEPDIENGLRRANYHPIPYYNKHTQQFWKQT